MCVCVRGQKFESSGSGFRDLEEGFTELEEGFTELGVMGWGRVLGVVC